MTTKTANATYPHGWCGFCNNPAVGDGYLNGAPEWYSRVKVCEAHKGRVWSYMPFEEIREET